MRSVIAVGRGEPSTAVYGTTRADIAAAFPDVPNSLYSGFSANIDTTQSIQWTSLRVRHASVAFA